MTAWQISPLPCKGWGRGRLPCSPRQRRAESRLVAAHPRRPCNCGFCADRTGVRVGRGQWHAVRYPRRRRLHPERREDMDLQWWDCRCLHALCPDWRRTGRTGGCPPLSSRPDMQGFAVAERLHTIAPHPLATLRLTDCRVPAHAMIGAPGQGFKIAMSVLDVFRTSVAAAALGFCPPRAGRGLDPRHHPPCAGRAVDKTCKWCKAILPIWRWTWMQARF